MQMLAGPLFSDRAAFVLNSNARAVNDRVVSELLSVVPAGDLFLSESLEDAERIADLIARRGYGRVFTGGGDGTLVSTLNLVEQACATRGRPMPEVGVLRLGTGNAVAGMLGAGRPKADAAHIASGGAASIRDIYMVRSEGAQAPFAGVGYDGEILNDYIAFKNLVTAKWPVLLPLVTSVLGYLLAMMFVTVPRYVAGKRVATVRMTSKHDAFKIVTDEDGTDHEVRIPAGEVIYEGRAPALCVGSVPFFGGGFKMFPHVFRREGHLQVRIAATSIPRILLNLFPRVWNGTYRHPELHDFLVKDVEVETDQPLAYQLGGDAEGMRDKLSFSVSEAPIKMVVLEDRASFSPLGLLKGAFGMGPALPKADATAVRRG